MTGKLFVCVERPDGTTFTQEIEWRDGELATNAVKRYERMLGRAYLVCDWWVE